MSRWDALRHCGLLCVFVAAVGAKAEDTADWDARYKEAVQSCILKSKKNTDCVYKVDANPLDHASLVVGGLYTAAYETAWRGVGAVVRGISAGDVWLEEDSPYWRRMNAEGNYEILKKAAQYKAKKDGLESCQKACLATCISSTMLEYDDRNLLTHWTEAVGREKGVCREFGAMAADVMRSLGLQARFVSGTVYTVVDGQAPKRDGGHVMVEVDLPNGRFTMEPQSEACEFYDSKFSQGVRHFETQSLNLVNVKVEDD